MKLSPSFRPVLTGLVIAASLAAQVSETKTAQFTRTYGPINAPVTVDMQAKATRGTTSFSLGGISIGPFPAQSASADLAASMAMFGHQGRPMSIAVSTGSSTLSSGSRLKVVLGGATMLDDNQGAVATWARTIGPANLFASDPTLNVSIAGVSVFVSCNVAVGADVSFATNSVGQADLSGSGRLFGTGRARATIASVGLTAGVRANLRMLDAEQRPTLHATKDAVSGNMVVNLGTTTMDLTVVLSMPFFGELGRRELLAFSAGALSSGLLLK